MKRAKSANRIRTLRKDAGLTQEALAEAADLERPHLSAIERRATLDATEAGTLKRLAAALGTTIDELFR